MKEYEYSKKVKNLDKYIDYCNNNGFMFVSQESQIRTIYRNKNKTIARLTINDINGTIEKRLDFKEDKLSNDELIIRKESSSITYTDDEAIKSILDFLNYKEDNTLERIRYVYKKDTSVFEFDRYVKPEKSLVVSLEGEQKVVDKIWNEIDYE